MKVVYSVSPTPDRYSRINISPLREIVREETNEGEKMG